MTLHLSQSLLTYFECETPSLRVVSLSHAVQYVPLAFVILAILGAIMRTYIRVSRGQHRVLDDYILLPFAYVSLIVSWILLYLGAPIFYSIFTTTIMVTNKSDEETKAAGLVKIIETVVEAQSWYDSFAATNWASIFAVKYCYSYFSRHLIDRQGVIVRYWKAAIALIFLAGLFEIFATLISCPYIGEASKVCAQPVLISRARKVVITTIVIDIITDLMSVSSPIYSSYHSYGN